jgi:hypothetical protein
VPHAQLFAPMSSQAPFILLLLLLLAKHAGALDTARPPSYFSPTPERWACAAWPTCELAGQNATPLCIVDASASALLDVPPAVDAMSTLRLRLETSDAAGMPCRTGGSTFRAWLDGPSLLPGHVLDHENGTYTVVLPTGWDSGKYRIFVVLDFVQCEGSSRCNTGHYALGTTKKVLLQKVHAPTQVVVTVPDRLQNSKVLSRNSAVRKELSGRWVRSKTGAKHKKEPSWRLTDPEAANAMKHADTPDNIRLLFTDRWIHLIGKSMTGVFRHSLVASIKAAGFRAVEGTLTKRSKHCSSHNSNAFVYVPELNLLITEESDANGMWKDEKTAETGFDVHLHLGCVDEMIVASSHGKASLSAALRGCGPDVVVFNHGIHSAAGLNSIAALETLKRYQVNAFSALSDAFAPNGTLLVWRNTAPTHFEQASLPKAWMCRTAHRMACINEVTRDALASIADVETLIARSGRWHELDFWTLGELRADCTPDNRHYRKHNCAIELLRNFLVMLPGWFADEKALRAPHRALVAHELRLLSRAIKG